MIVLAKAMQPSVDPFYADELAAAIMSADAIEGDDLAAVEHGIVALGGLIDRIILGEDGQIPLAPELWDAVLAYGETQATRERTWFAATGLDPDRRELPGIAEMMTR